MSANPPRNDAWRPYRDVRFVLARSPGRLKPCRGLILDWRRERRQWEAQEVFYDDAALEPSVRIAWLKPGQLIPVPVDPNYDSPRR